MSTTREIANREMEREKLDAAIIEQATQYKKAYTPGNKNELIELLYRIASQHQETRQRKMQNLPSASVLFNKPDDKDHGAFTNEEKRVISAAENKAFHLDLEYQMINMMLKAGYCINDDNTPDKLFFHKLLDLFVLKADPNEKLASVIDDIKKIRAVEKKEMAQYETEKKEEKTRYFDAELGGTIALRSKKALGKLDKQLDPETLSDPHIGTLALFCEKYIEESDVKLNQPQHLAYILHQMGHLSQSSLIELGFSENHLKALIAYEDMLADVYSNSQPVSENDKVNRELFTQLYLKLDELSGLSMENFRLSPDVRNIHLGKLDQPLFPPESSPVQQVKDWRNWLANSIDKLCKNYPAFEHGSHKLDVEKLKATLDQSRSINDKKASEKLFNKLMDFWKEAATVHPLLFSSKRSYQDFSKSVQTLNTKSGHHFNRMVGLILQECINMPDQLLTETQKKGLVKLIHDSQNKPLESNSHHKISYNLPPAPKHHLIEVALAPTSRKNSR